MFSDGGYKARPALSRFLVLMCLVGHNEESSLALILALVLAWFVKPMHNQRTTLDGASTELTFRKKDCKVVVVVETVILLLKVKLKTAS